MGEHVVGPFAPEDKAVCRSWNSVLLIGSLVGTAILSGCVGGTEVSPAPVVMAADSTPTDGDAEPGAPDERSADSKPPPAARAEPDEELPSVEALANLWGIEIVGVRLAAAGFMIDFRYRVTDPYKAIQLVDRTAEPRLIDQATGATLICPNTKVGPLRQITDRPVAGRTYSVLFSNPARFIKTGTKVTVAIGECWLDDLVVQ